MRSFRALPADVAQQQPWTAQQFALVAARFRANECGATSIEYSMIACSVAAFIAAIVFSLGSTLKTAFYDKLASMMP
jgi:Flp pilus assembly pilin Flp